MTATMERPRRRYLPELKERTAFLEESVRLEKLATDEEIAAYKPGGEENPAKDLGGWVFWFAQLVRFCGRKELKEAQASIASKGAERTVLDALRDAPEYVELQPVADGPPRRMAAHPKGFEALDFLDRHDQVIAWLNQQRAKLLLLPAPISAEPLAAVSRETLFQYGLIAFAVTHAGAGLPFPAGDPPAELPESIRELSPIDLIQLHGAFIRANVIRLHALYALLEMQLGETSNERLSWATFFSTRAEETGEPAQMLMRDRSLASQIAAALIAAEARKRALEEAKKEKPDNG
jgi:hypothetical protein